MLVCTNQKHYRGMINSGRLCISESLDAKLCDFANNYWGTQIDLDN